MRQASLLWQGATGWNWLVLALAGICLMGAAPAFAQDSSASDDEWPGRWAACAGGE